MKKFAIAVLILATLCSFAAAEPKYTYGYKGPQLESSIPESEYAYGHKTVRSDSSIYEPENTNGHETVRSDSTITGPKYTYGYEAPQSESSVPGSKYIYDDEVPQSESRIPDLFDFLGVEGEYVESFEDEEMNTIDVYAYPCSGAVNTQLLFADYADYAATAGCELVEVENEYISFEKDDMVFLLGVYEDEPATVYFAADTRLAIGGI